MFEFGPTFSPVTSITPAVPLVFVSHAVLSSGALKWHLIILRMLENLNK